MPDERGERDDLDVVVTIPTTENRRLNYRICVPIYRVVSSPTQQVTGPTENVISISTVKVTYSIIDVVKVIVSWTSYQCVTSRPLTLPSKNGLLS